MATDIPGLGKAPSSAAGRPLERMREELQILLGTRGDPLDAALTLRSAIERGLIDRIGNALGGSVTYVNTFPTTTVSGVDPTPDLTPPPTVAGLTVQAGFSQIIVQFTAPTYTQGHGNLQTNIYAVKKDPSDPTLPTFTAGVTPLVTAAPGALNIVSIPSELNTRWHVWAKHQTVDGVESVAVAGGVNGYEISAGVFPTTGQDITQLMELLAGQITESELYATLGARIDLIDAADTVAGSVSKRVKTETDARVAAISAEAGLRVAGDSTTLAGAASYTETWAYSRSQADSAIAFSASTVTTAFGVADAAVYSNAQSYVTGYAYSKSTVDTAIASSASTLTTAYQAADGLVLTDAQTYVGTYAYSKSTVDSALASLSSTLTAAYGSADTAAVAAADAAAAARDVTTLATANAYTYSQATIDGAIASSASTLTAAYQAADVVAVAAADASAASRDVSVLATANAFTYSRASIDGAIASSATTLTASYGSAISAAVAVESSARASLDGAVHALYTVRVETSSGGRTVVGGFGLAASALAGAGPRIDFGVRADQFYVAAPSGAGLSDAFPFIVRTSPSTENGVSIPAGVFMDSAYIVNLSAMYARFGSLIADSIAVGQISASNLKLGDGSVGGDLKSTIFRAGSGSTPGVGWELTPGGTLRASSAVIYGTIYASAGVFAGSLSAATGTFAGALSAATGTFAGDISAATGTFSGSLNVNSGGSTRMEITSSLIRGYNSGVLRFELSV